MSPGWCGRGFRECAGSGWARGSIPRRWREWAARSKFFQLSKYIPRQTALDPGQSSLPHWSGGEDGQDLPALPEQAVEEGTRTGVGCRAACEMGEVASELCGSVCGVTPAGVCPTPGVQGCCAGCRSGLVGLGQFVDVCPSSRIINATPRPHLRPPRRHQQPPTPLNQAHPCRLPPRTQPR